MVFHYGPVLLSLSRQNGENYVDGAFFCLITWVAGFEQLPGGRQ
jgi:hypothetical protein